MKKIIFVLFLSVLLPAGFTFAVRGGGGGGGFDGRVDGGGGDGRADGGGGFDGRGGDGWNGGNVSSPSNSFRTVRASSGNWRRMGITHAPRAISNRSHVLNAPREHSQVGLPSRGPGGAPFKASMVSPRNMSSEAVRSQMAGITRNAAFTSEINRYSSTETRVGQYYWHNFNGTNYCHYWDRWGGHWYGWYFGGSFFWSQYYWGYWWWYDPFWFRWCYWYDGWWWWQDPYYNSIYVYDDGQYIPDGTSGTPPASAGPVEYRSKDGTRAVKMMGQDAFLYDTSDAHAFKPIFLDSGVERAAFSNTSNGKPLRIMLELNDGSFELFDNKGNLLKDY